MRSHPLLPMPGGLCPQRSQSRSSAPCHPRWWRHHLYCPGWRQSPRSGLQSLSLPSLCFPAPAGLCPVGLTRLHATVGTAFPETMSVMGRTTARTAVMSWIVVRSRRGAVSSRAGGVARAGPQLNPARPTQAPPRPVSPTSSPVGMDTVPSSCGTAMATLTVRTALMRPTAVSVPGPCGPYPSLLGQVCLPPPGRV